ncbi:MAG: T9SS type A sorting domain-containing protein [Candidatus Electryonea clarkiae]|nr:T9SS type A sorting domain-containing protein [Candidatus Electryonea clarkiae]MDP8285322.1 T9SS type A sorting domain-containing protein [Candidatus Electryonea clarkiae]
MRHLTFIIISMAIAGIHASAQPPDTLWTRTFGGSMPEHGRCVQQTSDGGYIIVGMTQSFTAAGVWLIKADSNGEEEWNQSFGERNNPSAGHCVKQTNDGGYIIAGEIMRDDIWGNFDVKLIKTDSNGEEEWNQAFSGIGRDMAFSVIQINDGGYIIVGKTSPTVFIATDVWLIKIDSTGNEEWDRTFGGDRDDIGRCVQQTSDGGFIITGFTKSFGGGHENIWLIKTDSNGDEEWNQTFGGNAYDVGYSVQQTSDGGFIITGETESYESDNSDVCLIKTDSVGNEEWNRTFGGADWDSGREVQETFNGGYIIVGSTGSFGAGGSDVWLIKTDAEGGEEWNQTFGGINADYGYSVKQTNDEGYVIAGETRSFGIYNNFDVWLIRIAAEENEIIETTASSPRDYILEEVYPNPFNATTTIAFGLPAPSELKLSVYNITGKEVAVLANERYTVGYHQFTFNADELSSGIYFIHASVPGKMDEIRKVVLLR